MQELSPFPRVEDIAKAVRELTRGGSNATGTVTLTLSAASTVVTHDNCKDGSVPVLTPTTAAAAAEIGAGTLYVSAVTAGSFTLAHANSAVAGRTFLFALIGG